MGNRLSVWEIDLTGCWNCSDPVAAGSCETVKTSNEFEYGRSPEGKFFRGYSAIAASESEDIHFGLVCPDMGTLRRAWERLARVALDESAVQRVRIFAEQLNQGEDHV